MWFTMRKEDVGFVERARSVHVAEATMAAPRARVFGAFVDPESWPDWFPNVRRAAYTSPPPFGVGTIREAHVGGTRWVEEMMAWDDGRRWAWTVLRASVPFATAQVECFEFADAGAGTTDAVDARARSASGRAPRCERSRPAPSVGSSRVRRRTWTRGSTARRCDDDPRPRAGARLAGSPYRGRAARRRGGAHRRRRATSRPTSAARCC